MILAILKQLFGLLEPIATIEKDRRGLKDSALRSTSIALQETKIYYSNLERGSPPNKEIEAQLVRYWAAAAIPLRHFDEELALTCEHKAEYWVNSERWKEDDVEKLGIELENLAAAYRKMAMPTYSRIKSFETN